jgi:hypothetical protein
LIHRSEHCCTRLEQRIEEWAYGQFAIEPAAHGLRGAFRLPRLEATQVLCDPKSSQLTAQSSRCCSGDAGSISHDEHVLSRALTPCVNDGHEALLISVPAHRAIQRQRRMNVRYDAFMDEQCGRFDCGLRSVVRPIAHGLDALIAERFDPADIPDDSSARGNLGTAALQ